MAEQSATHPDGDPTSTFRLKMMEEVKEMIMASLVPLQASLHRPQQQMPEEHSYVSKDVEEEAYEEEYEEEAEATQALQKMKELVDMNNNQKSIKQKVTVKETINSAHFEMEVSNPDSIAAETQVTNVTAFQLLCG